MLKLDELSIDIILLIFQHCDIKDLCRLKETCQLFNRIIKSCLHLMIKNDSLVTNQANPILKQRTFSLLTAYEKYRISHNWKVGRYAEKAYLYENERFIPWLHLTKDHVWLSRGKYIRAYRRRKAGIDVSKPEYILNAAVTDTDVCKFTLKHNHLVAGQWFDGSFWCWSFEKDAYLFNMLNYHNSDVNCTDFNKDVIITGSKDKRVIVWPFHIGSSVEDNKLSPKHVFNLNDRVLSMSLCDNDKLLAVGTSGRGLAPLNLYDLNTNQLLYQLGSNFTRGSGILDMKWEDNSHCLYTCGYDMYVRKWDVRNGKLVQSWDDPFLSSIYCLDTDHSYTIISGTSAYGRAVLYDNRMKKCQQVYFMKTCKGGWTSPVYSLSFDSSHLVTATDLYLNFLNFAVRHNSRAKDYNISYTKEIVAYC